MNNKKSLFQFAPWALPFSYNEIEPWAQSEARRLGAQGEIGFFFSLRSMIDDAMREELAALDTDE